MSIGLHSSPPRLPRLAHIIVPRGELRLRVGDRVEVRLAGGVWRPAVVRSVLPTRSGTVLRVAPDGDAQDREATRQSGWRGGLMVVSLRTDSVRPRQA